jgi:hypothetical protein
MAIHIWGYLLLELGSFSAVLKEITGIYIVHRTLRSGERIAPLLRAKITRSGPTGKVVVPVPDGPS